MEEHLMSDEGEILRSLFGRKRVLGLLKVLVVDLRIRMLGGGLRWLWSKGRRGEAM